jgi:hypothetical protein
MRRFLILIFVGLITINFYSVTSNASDASIEINQASNSLKTWDIFLSGKCNGRVDYPHISSHVKGSVNVILNIDCPGEFTSITGILYRSPIKNPADLRVGHVSGKDKSKINLAVPCVSNEGMSVHSYFVTATFIATKHLPVVKTFSWPVRC